jgi:hypothetical protein
MGNEARDIIRRYAPDFPLRHCGRIYTDTTEFMSIDYGDVIAVGDRYYLVVRSEAERKFGLEDPKYWVKRCRDLEAGESRILKLVFHESFTEQIGAVTIKSHRSEHKEARILDLVRGDNRFMQGFSVPDDAGNLVRVLEIIRGRRLDEIVWAMDMDHETYFHEHFPGLLAKFIDSCLAIGHLHCHGEKHGDVRSDHIWVESSTGDWRWIDFDYTFEFAENPFGLDLFGLGNILLTITGKGVYSGKDLVPMGVPAERIDSLEPEDHSIIFTNRVMNLRKVFPYVPADLNNVLLRFSLRSDVFYDSVDELVDDLQGCLENLTQPQN